MERVTGAMDALRLRSTRKFHSFIPFHGHVVIRRQSRSFHPSNFVRIPFPVPSLCICASARKEEFDAVSLDEMLTGSHWRADEATAKRAFPAVFSSDSGVPILRYRRRVGVSGSPAVAFTGGRVLVVLCRARWVFCVQGPAGLRALSASFVSSQRLC